MAIFLVVGLDEVNPRGIMEAVMTVSFKELRFVVLFVVRDIPI